MSCRWFEKWLEKFGKFRYLFSVGKFNLGKINYILKKAIAGAIAGTSATPFGNSSPPPPDDIPDTEEFRPVALHR
jgi:hypothetical protein